MTWFWPKEYESKGWNFYFVFPEIKLLALHAHVFVPPVDRNVAME